MASDLARQVSMRYSDDACLSLADIVDGALQEVREVLEGLADYQRKGSCWCSVFIGEGDQHEYECQRARDLMLRLEVRP